MWLAAMILGGLLLLSVAWLLGWMSHAALQQQVEELEPVVYTQGDESHG